MRPGKVENSDGLGRTCLQDKDEDDLTLRSRFRDCRPTWKVQTLFERLAAKSKERASRNVRHDPRAKMQSETKPLSIDRTTKSSTGHSKSSLPDMQATVAHCHGVHCPIVILHHDLPRS